MPDHLSVRNWDKFQHYKDRRPPWIKYHVELLDDYELMAMPPFVQLVFDRMLLLAAITENLIPDDADWIGRRIHLPARRVRDAIAALVESKHLASAALAERKHDASAALSLARSRETETETETEKRRKNNTVADKSAVQAVYDHWRQARNKTDRRYDKLSEGRRAKIRARLKEFTVAELCQAIDGAAADPWDNRPLHDDLTILLRSREQTEKFLELQRNGGGKGPLTDEQRADKLRRRMAERGIE